MTATKLERFVKLAEDGVKVIRELLGKGVKVHILNMGLIEDTPMGRLILRMLSAIAEFDRDMIVEQLVGGKAIAKQKTDYKKGRPKEYSKKQIDHALKLKDNNSYKQAEDFTGISKSTLIRARRK